LRLNLSRPGQRTQAATLRLRQRRRVVHDTASFDGCRNLVRHNFVGHISIPSFGRVAVHLDSRDCDPERNNITFRGALDSSGTILNLTYVLNSSASGRCESDNGSRTLGSLGGCQVRGVCLTPHFHSTFSNGESCTEGMPVFGLPCPTILVAVPYGVDAGFGVK
jgi:hypothetical protein